jgi:hypothetical protein
MPISFHPDIIFINYAPHLLAYHSTVDVYSYLKDTSSDEKIRVYYPPLTCYTLAGAQFISRPLATGFDEWIERAGYLQTNTESYAQHYVALNETPYLLRYLFAMKLPYLFFDFGIAFLLMKMLADEKKKLRALKLWMVNPVTLHSAFMMGQLDVIPAFFLMAAVYFARQSHRSRLAFMLGLATAFKNIPAALFPVLLLTSGERIADRVKMALIGAAPYLLLLIPLYISSEGFVLYSIFPPILNDRASAFSPVNLIWTAAAAAIGLALFFAARRLASRWPMAVYTILFFALFESAVRLRLDLFPFLLVNLIVLAHFFLSKKHDGFHLSDYFLILLLSVFSVVPILFHYFVYVTPFLVLWLAERKEMTLVVAAQVMALAFYVLKDASVLAGLFTPLHPTFFASLPDFYTLSDPALSHPRVAQFLTYAENLARMVFRFSSWLIIAASVTRLFEAVRGESNAEAAV